MSDDNNNNDIVHDDDTVLRGVPAYQAHIERVHKLTISQKVIYDCLESEPQQLPGFKMSGRWTTTAGRLRRHFNGEGA